MLLDVMPNRDGYATTGAICGMPGLAEILVIAATARAMQEDRDTSIATGAGDSITKPVDTELLLARIQNWLAS